MFQTKKKQIFKHAWKFHSVTKYKREIKREKYFLKITDNKMEIEILMVLLKPLKVYYHNLLFILK